MQVFAGLSASGVRFARRQVVPPAVMTFCGWALLSAIVASGVVMRQFGYGS